MSAFLVQLAVSALGIAAGWLLGSRRNAGWTVALAANLAFAAYAVATAQWGLLPAEAVFAATNVRGWLAWRAARQPQEVPA